MYNNNASDYSVLIIMVLATGPYKNLKSP